MIRLMLVYALCGALAIIVAGVYEESRSRHLRSVRRKVGSSKIIMVGEGNSGSESLDAWLKKNGYDGYECWDSRKSVLFEVVQQDIDNDDCDNLAYLSAVFDKQYISDWKPFQLEYPSSFAPNRRQGIAKLLQCMMDRFQDGESTPKFVWYARNPCNWISSDSSWWSVDSESACTAAHSEKLSGWLNDQCGIYDLYTTNEHFRNSTALVVLESMDQAAMISSLQSIGISVNGTIPHVGHHRPQEDIFPKIEASAFSVLDFLEKSCQGQGVKLDEEMSVEITACVHNCHLCDRSEGCHGEFDRLKILS